MEKKFFQIYSIFLIKSSSREILFKNCQQKLWINERLSRKVFAKKIERNLVKPNCIAQVVIPPALLSEELKYQQLNQRL